MKIKPETLKHINMLSSLIQVHQGIIDTLRQAAISDVQDETGIDLIKDSYELDMQTGEVRPFEVVEENVVDGPAD